jgi:hypothetical protein
MKITDEQVIEMAARPQAWGNPEEVYERLRHIQQMTGANEFVLTFRFGTMPVETAERSMRLFAKEVLPRLQADETVLDAEIDGSSSLVVPANDPGHG